MLHPNDLTPDTLAQAMQHALSHPAPIFPFGFGGLLNAGAILSELLNSSVSAHERVGRA